MEILKDTGFLIKRAVHIGDIHFKKVKNYEEIINVIDLFIKMEEKQKTPTVLAILGDILDSGCSITDKSIFLLRHLFENASKTFLAIMIIFGNHDHHNEHIKDINPLITISSPYKNIYILNENKLYRYENLIFAVTLYDAEKVLVVNIKKRKNDKIIGLYHGTIQNSKIDNGLVLSGKIKLDDLKKENSGCDFFWLGDIHMRQLFSQTIGYSGSFSQLNKEESMDKGYLEWNLDTYTSQFRLIKNPVGRINVTYEDMLNIKIPKHIKTVKMYVSKGAYIKYEDIIIKKKELEQKNKYNIEIYEGTILKKDTKIESKIQILKENIDLASNEGVQKLVKTYLKRKYGKHSAVMLMNIINKEMMEMNYEYKQQNKLIMLENLKFANLFCYGGKVDENDIKKGIYNEKNNIYNELNFNKFKETISIYEMNDAGKSCTLDILLFSIYGKHTRHDIFKCLKKKNKEKEIEIGSDVQIEQINNKKITKCILGKKKNQTETENALLTDITLNVNDYKIRIIRRLARKYKTDNNPMSGKEWKCRYEKLYINDIDYTPKNRITSQIQTIINEKICTYDEFKSRTMVLQKSEECFVSATDNEKIKYISSRINFDVIEKLINKIDNKKKNIELEKKILEAELKKMNILNIDESINELTNKIILLNNDIQSVETSINDNRENINKNIIQFATNSTNILLKMDVFNSKLFNELYLKICNLKKVNLSTLDIKELSDLIINIENKLYTYKKIANKAYLVRDEGLEPSRTRH